jgi:hypothetical protein
LVLCADGVHVDGDALVVAAPHDQESVIRVYPADDLGRGPGATRSGDFVDQTAPPFGGAAAQGRAPVVEYRAGAVPTIFRPVEVEQVTDEPQPPPLVMGPAVSWRKGPVPLAPDDACYERATRLRLRLPDEIPTRQGRVLLTLDYLGDAARLYADGQLVDDHFYDGEPWLVGVDRFASAGRWPTFELAIIAAGDLPIFMEPAARARLAEASSRAELRSARAVWWRTARFEPRNGAWT